MKRFNRLFLIPTLIVILFVSCNRTGNELAIDYKNKNNFPIVGSSVTPVLIDTLDAKVVEISATAFSRDVNAITGKTPSVITELNTQKNLIIVGTIGKSKYIDQLIAQGKLDVSSIKNNWEAHQLEIIENPFPNVAKALVIAGADRRGTAYGIFELSKIIGVSPWIYWADVHPQKHNQLFISGEKKIISSPSVQYRGIFINDEDWGMQPWAATNIDTDIKDIGPKTYALVFELMLRLKTNFLWPAMHPCTKAFYYYPENPKVANDYAIVVGASHCEPMNRNNVFEWKQNFKSEYNKTPGDWRYDTNKEQIYKYWDDRIKVSNDYENFYTVGMRGIHDSGMPGPKDTKSKISLLENVINDQRKIFDTYYDGNTIVPQLFCPYKEVLTLYKRGLDLPDDVTIVWADDNHGYIRQLSNSEEQKRSGGSGVYYHISYWGKPHDYLWLSSTSPALISYELTKAYQFNAQKLWVLNVGDIKPAEMEIEFFADLAWDVDQWLPQNAEKYYRKWALETFGNDFADDIAAIKKEYYRLAQNGKPEHLRMLSFDGEVQNERLHDYAKLLETVEALERKMPDHLQDAFFQLIKYPVEGAALMNEKVFYAERSMKLLQEKSDEAITYSQKSIEAYEKIHQLTKQYNEEIANGKWNKMMSASPRNLPVFGKPHVAKEEWVLNPELTETVDVTKNKYLDNVPASSSNPEYFRTGNFVSIPSVDYLKIDDFSDDKIVEIPGLGLGGTSVSRFPFNGKSYTLKESDQAPSLTYGIQVVSAEYAISVKCVPTQGISDGRKVSYAISVNNSDPVIVDVDVSRDRGAWGKSVLRGFSEGVTNHHLGKKNIIRIYLLDTNIAVSRIELRKLE